LENRRQVSTARAKQLADQLGFFKKKIFEKFFLVVYPILRLQHVLLQM